MERDNSFSGLGYTSLADLLQRGPTTVRAMAASAGHLDAPLDEKEFQVTKREVEIKAERGQLFLHTKREVKVTIIKPNVSISDSGEKVHLVVESKTGKQFKALNCYLKSI